MSESGLDLRGRRVVVTGGRGFLGRYVCKQLSRQGAHVFALGRKDYDLTRQVDVDRMYGDLNPSVLIHAAAACGGIGANVEHPGRFLYENAVMGLLLLEAGRRSNIDKFVLVSTTCAYPEAATAPFTEEQLWDGAPTAATRPYGIAKRMLHEACATYQRQYGLRSAVLVPANLYGPEDHFDPQVSHVIPALIRRYVEAVDRGAREVVNWGTGTPTREFLHVSDAARAIVLAAEKVADPMPINLGTGVETSIRELTLLVAKVTGFSGNVAWDTKKPDGQPRRYLDVTRANELLHFRAQISLEAGIEETVAWYRARMS